MPTSMAIATKSNGTNNDEKTIITSSTSSNSLTSTSSSSTSSSSTTSSNNPSSTTTKTTRSKDRQITWKELKEHSYSKSNSKSSNNNKSLWIALHGKVYDITTFAQNHPGGNVIYEYAGRDATDEFDAFHLPRVKKSRLPSYCIGTLVDGPDMLPVTKDYRILREKLWKEGWFDADWNYYVQKDILALTILTVGISLILFGESVMTRVLAGGCFVGLALQQIAFVAHDAGHRGITPPQAGGGINWLGWFHGAVCFGVSIEMWVDEHSGHHAMTMRPHEDPQFKYLPIFMVSSKELDRFEELSSVEQYLAKWLVPVQHYTLIPISVIIGRFNLHVISLVYALKAKKFYDVFGLALYLVWFGTVTSLLPSTGERAAFVLIAYIVAGILHVQLTISHLATNSFTAEEDEKEQFFAFQCKTTRNIDSTWIDDWFHGGLQFQIEHHLFPQLPRHNLIKVKPLVEELCKKHGIEYSTTSFYNAVAECLSDFKRLSYFMSDLVHPHEIMPESS